MSGKFLTEIQDGQSVYTCDTAEKGKAIEYISWFLREVYGTARVTIQYSQDEQPALLDPYEATPARNDFHP